jgi:DNA helicase IV
MAPDLGVPVSVRDNPGRLEILRVQGAGLYERVAESVAETSRIPGSTGVIVPDAATEVASKALSRHGVEHGVLGANHGDLDHQVNVIPATVAKGLEFDRVIVVEPSAIAAAEPDRRTGLRRLYVVLTRAVSELTVFHSEDLPVELAE